MKQVSRLYNTNINNIRRHESLFFLQINELAKYIYCFLLTSQGLNHKNTEETKRGEDLDIANQVTLDTDVL